MIGAALVFGLSGWNPLLGLGICFGFALAMLLLRRRIDRSLGL